MPAARAPTLALALLSTFGRSLGIEDAAALIQQRQAVEALEATSSEVIPTVGADGVYFRRLSTLSETGSSILRNYSKDHWNICDQEDSWGPKECGLFFGTTFWQTYKIHLAGGANSGDVLSESYTVALDHDATSPLSFLVPGDLTMTSTCGLCGNSCRLSSTKATYSFNITKPTSLDSLEICDSSITPKPEEFVISNRTAFWPKPPMGLTLKGDVNMTTSVIDKDGNVRAQASYLYRVPGAGSSATFAADVGGALEGQGQGLDAPPMEAVGLIREVLFGAAAEAMEAAGKFWGDGSAGPRVSLAESTKSSSHALVLNLTVKGLAPGSSISVSADQGCNATDSSGSIVCEFSLDQNVTFTSALDISFTAAEGSTMYASADAKVGGNLGAIFGKKFKKKEVTVPLCGASPSVVTDSKGIQHQYQPGKCGDYAFQFQSSAQEFKKLPSLINIPLPRIPFMPFLPKTLKDLLPMSQLAELKLKNADNSTLVWVEVGFGLKEL